MTQELTLYDSELRRRIYWSFFWAVCCWAAALKRFGVECAKAAQGMIRFGAEAKRQSEIAGKAGRRGRKRAE